MASTATDRFIERWQSSGGSERANYQLFLAELCDLLGVERPDPARPDNLEKAYVFERSLRFKTAEGEITTNFIDLYKQDCFVDAHRKAQLAAHSNLTLTGIYNILEKLRTGEPLTQKDETIYEQGLVGVLKELHDELDATVADAYGWPVDLPGEQILENLLALNIERAAEERAGIIRWLRPDYQNPDGKDPATQAEIAVAAQEEARKASKPKLPADLPGRFAAVRLVLVELPEGGDTNAIASHFKNAKRKTVNEILETLVGLGQVSCGDSGRYVL